MTATILVGSGTEFGQPGNKSRVVRGKTSTVIPSSPRGSGDTPKVPHPGGPRRRRPYCRSRLTACRVPSRTGSRPALAADRPSTASTARASRSRAPRRTPSITGPAASPRRSPVPCLVATIVAVASLLAVLPTVSGDAVGRTQGSGQDVRIAVNGGFDRFANQYEQ